MEKEGGSVHGLPFPNVGLQCDSKSVPTALQLLAVSFWATAVKYDGKNPAPRLILFADYPNTRGLYADYSQTTRRLHADYPQTTRGLLADRVNIDMTMVALYLEIIS